MKIRIKGNSIRLRLSKTDIQSLKENGRVIEHTILSGEEAFVYILERADTAAAIGASFSEGKLRVWLPLSMASQLTDTKDMGVQSIQENGAAGGLSILIEKDLQCLENTNEDQSDMYDNPKKSC